MHEREEISSLSRFPSLNACTYHGLKQKTLSSKYVNGPIAHDL